MAFTFGVPAICDGIAMGHKGMHYSLPSRELIADTIESVAEAHQLDGLVLLTACDKITPGMLLAAAELLTSGVVPDERAVRQALAGNLCRCTGYTKIIAAVRAAAASLGGADGR